MSFEWSKFNFRDYVPMRVTELIPETDYVAISTSDKIYPNHKWLIRFHYIRIIDPNSPSEYLQVTMRDSTENKFKKLNNHNMVFCSNDRDFYNANIIKTEQYLHNNSTTLPPDIIFHISGF